MKKKNMVAVAIAIVGGVLGGVANLVQDDAYHDIKDAITAKIESKKKEDAE